MNREINRNYATVLSFRKLARMFESRGLLLDRDPRRQSKTKKVL